MVLPLGGAMVIDPMDLMCNHHLTPTRGGMETVNRNLNGAGIPIRCAVVKFRRSVSPEATRTAGAGWTASLKRAVTFPILSIMDAIAAWYRGRVISVTVL